MTNSNLPPSESSDTPPRAVSPRPVSRPLSPGRTPFDSSSRSTAPEVSRGTTAKLLSVALLLLAAVLLPAAALLAYLDLPEVHVSSETRECVRVVNADGTAGSCDDLPERYHHVWVK